MPIYNPSSDTGYKLDAYSREDEFERDVVAQANRIFGDSTIYIDVKRRVKGNNVVTIPDGYVIDLTNPDEPQLFIIENEIVSHDPFSHIGVQMLKFATSFDGARKAIRDFLMEEIVKSEVNTKKLHSASRKAGSRNVDAYLEVAVYREFKGIVIIDEARDELHQVLRRIDATISVLEFKRYRSEDGNCLYLFDTLYDEDAELEPDTAMPSRDPEAAARRRERRAMADTVVVPARREGFEDVFIGENQWYAIRIGAAMRDKLRYVAAYQVAPISAITHLAEIDHIKLYKDTGKYVLIFKGPAKEIKHIPGGELKGALQGPVYSTYEKLMAANNVGDILN